MYLKGKNIRVVNKYLNLLKDIFIITIGLFVSSFGTVLFYQAELGASPMATFCDGLHIILDLSYGTTNTLANVFLIIILIFIKREYINIGTVMCVILIGPFIDIITMLFNAIDISETSMIIRIVFVIIGTIFMGIGLGLYVSVDRGLGALEALVKYFCAKTCMSYSKVKIAQDVILVLMGIVLSATIGIGTVIAVFLTGPILQKSIKFFTPILCKEKTKV